MADLEDKGWVGHNAHWPCLQRPRSSEQERYICIEPGYVSEFKSLKPEERWIGQQVLTVF